MCARKKSRPRKERRAGLSGPIAARQVMMLAAGLDELDQQMKEVYAGKRRLKDVKLPDPSQVLFLHGSSRKCAWCGSPIDELRGNPYCDSCLRDMPGIEFSGAVEGWQP